MNINKISTFALFFMLLISSCKKDDPVEVPTISYVSNIMEARFFTGGNSSIPTIDWGGEKGTLSISRSIDGLSINASTGVLNWNRVLPIGSHTFEVVASNSAGASSVSITINNRLQGKFVGTYTDPGGSYYFATTFSKDGTVVVETKDGNNNSVPADGLWKLNGSEVQVDYRYSPTDKYSLKGTLTQTVSEATYSGKWYWEYGVLPANEGGVFTVTMY